MHWLDFVLILVLGLGGLLGLRSGLLWQVARIIIFVAAIYACIHFHGDVAQYLEKQFDGLNDSTARLMSYGVIFLGVCLIGSLITWVLEGMLKAASLKPLDRILGGLLGVLKTALLAGGVLTGVALYGSKQTQESIADSKIAPLVLDGMRWVLAVVPPKIKEELDRGIEQIKKTASEKSREAERERPETRDREFVGKGIADSATNIKLAERALRQQNITVRRFAQRMQADHTRIREALLERAAEMNVSVVEGTDVDRRERVDRISRSVGSDFDREYTRFMVEVHEKALPGWEKCAGEAQDQKLRELAQRAAPTIKDLLEYGRKLAPPPQQPTWGPLTPKPNP